MNSIVELQNLKDSFVNEMLKQLLTNSLKTGEKLPSERIISENMGISRNVVRVGLVELTARGFLRTEQRRGTFVMDYMREGNMLTLDAVSHAQVPVMPVVLRSLLDFRMLTLCESAELCALRRSENDLARLASIIDEQSRLDNSQDDEFTRLDFLYHKEIYILSGNILYPMVHNSVKTMHGVLVLEFYKTFPDKGPVKKIHQEIYNAIERSDPQAARKWMRKVLELGNEVMSSLSYLPG
jgi:DNA-binding FadR family transcriptional regulator